MSNLETKLGLSRRASASAFEIHRAAIAGRRMLAMWLSVALLSVFVGGAAQAAPIFSGDQTTLVVTSFFNLTDAGFDLSPLGDARMGDDIVLDQNTGLPRKLAALPITGGGISLVTGDVLIDHLGSGLLLSEDDSGNAIALEDFQILLSGGAPEGGVIGTLFGQVSVNDGLPLVSAPLFDITRCGLASDPRCFDSDDSLILSGLRLGLTEGASELLNEVFSTDFFYEGAQLGIARVDVRVVPEPSTLMLTSLGLIGLGVYRRQALRG